MENLKELKLAVLNYKLWKPLSTVERKVVTRCKDGEMVREYLCVEEDAPAWRDIVREAEAHAT